MPVGQKSQRKHGRKKLSERGDTYYVTKSMAVRGFENLCDEFDKKKHGFSFLDSYIFRW